MSRGGPAPRIERLRQKIEEGDRDHRAGTEAQDQVKTIVQAERCQPAQHGRGDAPKATAITKCAVMNAPLFGF